MALSESANTNGWKHVPASWWNKKRPQTRTRDLDFWEYCVSKYGDPVLDIACGNGRHTLALAKKGYQVTGIDVNADLISSANSAVSNNMTATFINGDIVDFTIEQKFGVAIMPDNAFPVIVSQEDQISFFKCLHRHLRQGGAFAFNFRNPFWKFESAEIVEGMIRLPAVSDRAVFNPLTQVEEDSDPEGIVKLRHRYTTFGEVELLLRLSGFRISDLFGGLDRRPYSGRRDDEYVIVAKKIS